MSNDLTPAAPIATVDQTPSTAATTFAFKSFDYSIVENTVADKLQKAAAAINLELKCGTAAKVAIGQHLNAIKGDLQHGQFELWLQSEFEMSKGTARNYMNCATFVAKFTESKKTIFMVLPKAALYLLSAPSTPQPACKKVLEMVEAGHKLRVADIVSIIRAAKNAPEKLVSQTAPSFGSPGAQVVADRATGVQDVAEATTEKEPTKELGTGAAPTHDALLTDLSKIIAARDEQRTANSSCIDFLEHAEECLQRLVTTTGDYSLLVPLSELVETTGGHLALVVQLRNFGKYQKAISRLAEIDASDKRLAA